MTVPQDLPPEFLELLHSIKSKRPKTVIDHILAFGSITTEQLKNISGYNHLPRAIKDVRDLGIPIEKFSVKDDANRTIAAYRFGDPKQVRNDVLSGRKIFSKEFKNSLIQSSSSSCAICLQVYEARYLQIDHRVPYEVSGDVETARNLQDYMLLCGSCTRAKSWSCEHCENWQITKEAAICKTCYWANPMSYEHVAMLPIRRLDVVWSDNEIDVYEQLKILAQDQGDTIPDYVKNVLQNHISNRRS